MQNNINYLKELVKKLALLNLKVARFYKISNLREVDKLIYRNKFKASYSTACKNLFEFDRVRKGLFLNEILMLKYEIESCILKDTYIGIMKKPSELTSELQNYYTKVLLSN